MAAKLVAEEGTLKGLVLSLEDGNQWVIGRDPDACQLLVEDPSTSRKHLVCRLTPQGIQVENLSTTNPIQVNDEEVKEPRLLQNGDAVRIGDGTFRFYAEAAAHLFNENNNTKQEVSITPISPELASTEENKDQTPEKEKLDEEKAKEEKPQEEKPQEEIKAAPLAKEDQGREKQDEEKQAKEEQKEEGQKVMEAPQLEEEFEIENTALQPSPTPQPLPKDPAIPTSAPTENNDSKNVDEEDRHDTIFGEENEKAPLAEINFGLLETGRWLLKVITGPNNGAEFQMQTGSSYVIGTDPNTCDIVFHDTSVSRQHARITIGSDDAIFIEDLKSRNGTTVDGEPVKEKIKLATNLIVTIGTTSFVVFDREGEMRTIISPLMPSIVRTLKEDTKDDEGTSATKPEEAAAAAQAATPPPEVPHHIHLGAFILIGILTGLFVIVGIGVTTLFKSEPVVIQQTVDPTQMLDSALAQFPSVKYTFNKGTGQLLLVGHVQTASDRSQLLYSLRGMNFIKSLDDSGIVIDEYVWREINQVVEKNPDWKGITIMAPTPGHFVVSGYLKTRAQADRLSEYLNANFPYPDLLEKRVVVDEEVTSSIVSILQNRGFNSVTAKLDNGEVTLKGPIPIGKGKDFDAAVAAIKEIRGVRSVRNLASEQQPEQAFVNISDKYEVTGISNQSGKFSVVINGRILMQGDALDGMTITGIQPHAIYLEKGVTKYRIDYNK